MKNKQQRSSGILMHISSLPSKYGIGSFGKEAYEFVDFLNQTGQKIWQILPLGHTGYGDSPYQCYSAFAGNPLFIDIDELMNQGLLSHEDIPDDIIFEETEFDTIKTVLFKYPLLRKAFNNFHYNSPEDSRESFNKFCNNNSFWLEDYALFIALKKHFEDKPWYEWEAKIKLRDNIEIEKYRELLKQETLFNKTVQFFFYEQWMRLKAYANISNINIFGDIPLYVAYDSSDAWTNSDIFQFDNDKKPIAVAGVPPDYFSETGQLWGNPLYNWERLKETGFNWWVERIKENFTLYNILRIDHFRGLAEYWSVPFGEETAVKGQWISAPGHELIETIINHLGNIPIIAEDLGVINEEVENLRDRFNFPGMKILQFAFDSNEESDFLPHTYIQNCVVYTGTHDNDTTVGWYNSANEESKAAMHDYFNFKPQNVHWELIRLAWSSVAYIAIAPMQDILGLDTTHRMNLPGISTGYWKWRMKKDAITPAIIERLKKYTTVYWR